VVLQPAALPVEVPALVRDAPAQAPTAKETLEAAAETLQAAGEDADGGKTLSDRVFDAAPMPAASGEVVFADVPAPPAAAAEDHLVRVKGLAPFLSVADAADRAWMTGVLEKAMSTRTGRRVLRRTAGVASRRGQPIPVQVEALKGEYGSFVYDWDVLQLAASLKGVDSDQAAPILVHELLHFCQRDIGLPVDALEMELEAHIVTLQVFRELGIKPGRSTFSAGFQRALLKGGPPGAVEWLAESYDKNIGILNGRSMKDYVAELQSRREKILKGKARLERLLAKRSAVYDDMKASGLSEAAVRNYDLDQVEPVMRRLRDQGAELFWVDRDLGILGTPEGRERYRAFSQRVTKRILRFHETLTRGGD
jgi:hypothetical protein